MANETVGKIKNILCSGFSIRRFNEEIWVLMDDCVSIIDPSPKGLIIEEAINKVSKEKMYLVDSIFVNPTVFRHLSIEGRINPYQHKIIRDGERIIVQGVRFFAHSEERLFRVVISSKSGGIKIGSANEIFAEV